MKNNDSLGRGLGLFLFLAAGCASVSVEEQACRHIAGTVDCRTLKTEAAIDECIEEYEDFRAVNDSPGCVEELDLVLECYGRTNYFSSGDNGPGCNTEENTWLACRSLAGVTCPSIM